MPPPRKVKSAPNKVPIAAQNTTDEDSLEAELKFDKDVLWCITQFEKLLTTGLNDSKKQESLKAIKTLKKSNTPKIQKVQLMRHYFKDYKAKMQKEEDEIKSVNFENQSELPKGLFLKKKVDATTISTDSEFLFNFKS